MQPPTVVSKTSAVYESGRSDRPPPGRLWSVRQRSVGATLCVACAAYLLREGLAGGIGPGPDEEAAAGPGGRLEALTGAILRPQAGRLERCVHPEAKKALEALKLVSRGQSLSPPSRASRYRPVRRRIFSAAAGSKDVRVSAPSPGLWLFPPTYKTLRSLPKLTRQNQSWVAGFC